MCNHFGPHSKHKRFGPVGLGTTPGLSQGQTGFVPGTNPLCPRHKPRYSPNLHDGSPVRPWDKPSLSLGQSRDEGRQKMVVLKVYLPFSLAFSSLELFWGFGLDIFETPVTLTPPPTENFKHFKFFQKTKT